MRVGTLVLVPLLMIISSAASPAIAFDGVGHGSEMGTHSPIKHTIILYQENISFDHYFGTFGHGSNGIPAGSTLTHRSPTNVAYGPYAPTRLKGTTQSYTCDVDHGYVDMIKMADHGAMDRYLQFGNDEIEPNPSTAATCPAFETLAAPGSGATALANAYYDGKPGDPTAPLQHYWDLATRYTLADNFFQGMYGPSTPGAEWLVAATANTVHDPNPVGDVCNDYGGKLMPQRNIPNLGAEASARGTSWAWFQGGFGKCVGNANPALVVTNGYSAHHDPFQYFTTTADPRHAWAWDPKMDYAESDRHQRDLDVLYAALAGTAIGGMVPELPAISWVKAPTASDGHPAYSAPGPDDAFVGDLYQRLHASRYWRDSVLFIAFDETGGWWDHVAPPDLGGRFAAWVNGQPNLTGCQYAGNGDPCGEAGLGPRMPVLVISPYAKRGFIDHDLLDTSSLVNWVEWNHRLPELGVWGRRDALAGSLRNAFVFGLDDTGLD